jgi:hypothetical protein
MMFIFLLTILFLFVTLFRPNPIHQTTVHVVLQSVMNTQRPRLSEGLGSDYAHRGLSKQLVDLETMAVATPLGDKLDF